MLLLLGGYEIFAVKNCCLLLVEGGDFHQFLIFFVFIHNVLLVEKI